MKVWNRVVQLHVLLYDSSQRHGIVSFDLSLTCGTAATCPSSSRPRGAAAVALFQRTGVHSVPFRSSRGSRLMETKVAGSRSPRASSLVMMGLRDLGNLDDAGH